jgi:hypothetical protein
MWEAVTALATLGTGIAIILTVLLGVRQLRVTGAQLDQLRRATQLEGAMKIFEDLNSDEFRDSMRFIMNEVPKRMADPTFRAEVALGGMADDKVHKELHVMRTFERVGTYVRSGLIDGPIVYNYAISVIAVTWEGLVDVVRSHRDAHGEGFWENYEFLYTDAIQWRDGSQKARYKVASWRLPESAQRQGTDAARSTELNPPGR